MKKVFMLISLIAVCCIASVVTVLEVFDLHPQYCSGDYAVIWLGVKHADWKCTSGSGIIPYTDGRKELHKDYHFGPVQIDYNHWLPGSAVRRAESGIRNAITTH